MVQSKYFLTHPLPLLFAAASLLGADAPPSLTLFDFKAGFDRKLLSTARPDVGITPAGRSPDPARPSGRLARCDPEGARGEVEPLALRLHRVRRPEPGNGAGRDP